MKIIGGKYKNRNFYMPKEVRATQNVVRKAIFDLLGQDLEGLRCLELYAGSGAIGLEALSRGAASVVFVERERKFAQVIEENLSLFGIDIYGEISPQAQVFTSDSFVAIRQLTRHKQKFDLILLDPPYGEELAKKTLKTLEGCDILHPNCLLVIQHEKREILPPAEGPFVLETQRSYGGTHISIYRNKL